METYLLIIIALYFAINIFALGVNWNSITENDNGYSVGTRCIIVLLMFFLGIPMFIVILTISALLQSDVINFYMAVIMGDYNNLDKMRLAAIVDLYNRFKDADRKTFSERLLTGHSIKLIYKKNKQLFDEICKEKGFQFEFQNS